MEKVFEAVGLDFPCMDCLIRLPHMPGSNESMRVLETSWQSGGKTATAAAALGRLGVRTALLGSVCGDAWGRFCRSDLAYNGVDASRVRLAGGRTGLNLVLSDQASMGRSILYSGSEREPYCLEETDREWIRRARILLLCHWGDTQLEAAKTAREAGTLVLYDGDGYGERVQELLPYIDVFIGSEFFYRERFGHRGNDLEEIRSACQALREEGPRIVGFTFGGEGSAALDETGFYSVRPPKVAVMDTVGAGDAYHGAFAYGLLQGWPLPGTLEFAGTLASMKCRYIGGRAGLPTLEMVQEFLASGESGEGDIPQRLEHYSRLWEE